MIFLQFAFFTMKNELHTNYNPFSNSARLFSPACCIQSRLSLVFFFVQLFFSVLCIMHRDNVSFNFTVTRLQCDVLSFFHMLPCIPPPMRKCIPTASYMNLERMNVRVLQRTAQTAT